MGEVLAERRWIIPERRKRLTRKEFRELFLRQDGRCGCCDQDLTAKGGVEVEIIDEHLIALSIGGSNDLKNRELWCKPCTGPKTANEAHERAKGDRAMDLFIGAKVSRRPMPCGRNSAWKKPLGSWTAIRRVK